MLPASGPRANFPSDTLTPTNECDNFFIFQYFGILAGPDTLPDDSRQEETGAG
jgi:hypothetical protein